MKRKGFTLVELLVVIAIIAVLMSMLMPALNKAKEQAKKVWCQANVRGMMLCTLTYVQGNDDYLPFSGRGSVKMGMLDVPYLLSAEGLDVRKLHCPGDIEKPGSIAWWFRTWAHRTIVAADHIGGAPPVGVEPEADYSYYWYWKMYNDLEPATHPGAKPGDMRVGGGTKSWRLSDVKYPSRLVALGDFLTLRDGSEISGEAVGSIGEYPWPHSSKRAKGYMCGFLDGRSAFIRVNEVEVEKSHLWNGIMADDPDYINFDHTPNGIKGYDIK